jgi:hypothetical protein
VPDFPARVQSHIPGLCPGVAAHLWSTGYSARAVCLCQLVHPFRREGRWCGGRRGAGTLLGPEGTAACPGFFLLAGRRALPGDGRGCRGRPYLENCTVDASITL